LQLAIEEPGLRAARQSRFSMQTIGRIANGLRCSGANSSGKVAES
jgi:hypothetical protein